MNTLAPTRHQLMDTINKLPVEVLPELASFLNYLQFKVESPVQSEPSGSGTKFLLSIAGIGEAEEDLSERDEEILAAEIDPIRGWGFDNGAQS